MKFNFDIECTPEEARKFIGLPDVATMQEAMMKEIEAKMRENLKTLSPDEFIKTWMPATMQGWQDMQKAFWGQMGVGMGSDSEAQKAKK